MYFRSLRDPPLTVLTNLFSQVDFKYAIDIPFLLDSDWKGIESYKEYTEGEPGNVLRKFSEETDPDEIEIDTGERVTVRLE